MTDYENHAKLLARERAKRYYNANKATILQKRKDKRVEIRRLFETQQVPAEVSSPQNLALEAPDAQQTETTIRANQTNPVLTNEANVKKALKETDHFKEEGTRKVNLAQIPLLFRATKNEPLLNWFKKPKQLLESIKKLKQTSGKNKGKPYAISGLQKILGCVLNIVKIMNLQITPEQDKVLYNAYKTAKLEYDLTLYRKKHPVLNSKMNVENYDDILKEAKKKGQDSLTYLIASLYQYCPLRNDYSNMILVDDENDMKPDNNYMILSPKRKARVVIQKHKTLKTSGVIRYEFNETITKMIRNYVSKNEIKNSEKLFDNLKTTLHEITKNKDTDREDGGTRTIRRSLASTLYDKYLNKKATVEDIYEQTLLMGHTANTHISNYIYSVT